MFDCHDNSVPPRVPCGMLPTPKLSGYLLSLLLTPEFFLTGSKSLSERLILLLLRAGKTKTSRESVSGNKREKDQLRGYCHVSVLTLNLGESYLKKMQVVFKGYASELFLDCALALGEQHTVFFLRKGLM